jgi:hypothetical protein
MMEAHMKCSLAILTFIVLAGCVTHHEGRTAAPATPDSARPGRVALAASDRFEDSDANGFRDLATVTAYIIPEAADYPLPMKARGTFDFVLQTRQGQRLAEWKFDQSQTAEAQYDLAPGPGFIFELSLLQTGGDRIQADEADLLCTFTPDKGESVRSRAPVRVIIGPVGGVRATR